MVCRWRGGGRSGGAGSGVDATSAPRIAAPLDTVEPTATERRCLVTGVIRPKTALVRFVVGPDGAVVPDVAARLPGRGLWLTADRVEHLLRRRCGDLIGLARRSGKAVAGYEKVRSALRDGEAAVLLAAADGGENGREKVRAAGPDLPLVDVLTAAELGAAFGREHVVHAAVGPGRLAKALLVDAARLVGFRAAPEEIEIGRGRQQRRRRNANDGTGSR